MRARGAHGTRLVSAAALGTSIALLLVGCVTPPVSIDPSASPAPSQHAPTPSAAPSESAPPEPSDYPSELPGEGGPDPDQPIDPEHPWPADVPRPPGTVVS